ncbi:MAG TPA: YifB family Mg chelatase-like AAA ATPase [Candidatus Baltobacteraceae bacterium]|jgi:magnesium chelatase family protein|nr:YifB family Mg chelatase-like AAA ATPase [Candidatus Baltobacteraceae bacterium]
MPLLILARSASVLGVDGFVVRVEAHSAAGTPSFTIVGLPDRALAEARERVRAALITCGYAFPSGKLLINLSPADIRKEGPGFDLAIALALLAIDEQTDHRRLAQVVALGELALDGTLLPVRGILAMVLGAREAGITEAILPSANAAEAALVEGITAYGVPHLSDAVAVLAGYGDRYRIGPPIAENRVVHSVGDFADVIGQTSAKRALEIAAAGGHNVALVGPPGCGKTMLAGRLPSIFPAMTGDEALEVTKIAGAAGIAPTGRVISLRPFRTPHHTISQAALVGGGTTPRPGEVSLAHRGVLFLDEFGEFRRSALETLRQPMEQGTVTIARTSATITYPARFTLVVASNPCPCGFRGLRDADCRCDENAVARYYSKLSGPLLDRIDVRIEVPRVNVDDLLARDAPESSTSIRARVEQVRTIQHERYADHPSLNNASVPGPELRARCPLSAEAESLLRHAAARNTLSARAMDRIVRVARTIGDLAGSASIRAEHIAEAILFRGDRSLGR